MITLTTAGDGSASNTFNEGGATTIKVSQGTRYAVGWTFNSATQPVAGTLLPLLIWSTPEQTESSFFFDQAGDQITNDLSGLKNGAFEFVAPVDGWVYFQITGAGAASIVHINVARILP